MYLILLMIFFWKTVVAGKHNCTTIEIYDSLNQSISQTFTRNRSLYYSETNYLMWWDVIENQWAFNLGFPTPILSEIKVIISQYNILWHIRALKGQKHCKFRRRAIPSWTKGKSLLNLRAIRLPVTSSDSKYHWGTSINDVTWFWAIFDLPTYLPWSLPLLLKPI